MTSKPNAYSAFLQKLISIIDTHIEEENFGVSELAEEVHMSRSNLLRKVKQESNLSVSVFIRNRRLEKAQELLSKKELSVSEVAYKVGFSSTSYFTKCYRELYGSAPGEWVQKNDLKAEEKEEAIPHKKEKKLKKYGLAALILLILAALVYFFTPVNNKPPAAALNKTLAVLPFKNDSQDSSNIYFMNGLMEAILDNFQKIEDLKVTSRTTVEKYRNNLKSIPELSQELGVSYFLEGSGQKIGDEILLTIQLIEAPSDKHLWSKRYRREMKDVFRLQADVAKSIASEINAIITPQEIKRIEKIPTNNLVAYDYYLRGLTLLKDDSGEGLEEGIEQFKKAIQEDPSFANAYAYIAISYYYLDVFRQDKQHTEILKNYADKSMQLDSTIGESLIAHALYFMQIKAYPKAVEAFEEVLGYYPNTAWIHNFLSDIYSYIIPDTKKYLMHALQGVEVAVAGADSTVASFTYLHLSNALAQTGFLEEAKKYADQSLAYNPANHYSQYLKVYIQLGLDFDLERTKKDLTAIYVKDTSRIDVIQELAKVCYTMKDYEEAWYYYKKMVDLRESLQLDIYFNADINIAFILEQLGKNDQATSFYSSYLNYAENDHSIYRPLTFSAYYAAKGDIDKAIAYLKEFSKEDNYQYWFVLFMDKDPILEKMNSHPDFKPTVEKIQSNFWNTHAELKKELKKKDLL